MTYADYKELDFYHKKNYIYKHRSNAIGGVCFCDEIRRLYSEKADKIFRYDDIKKVIHQPITDTYQITRKNKQSNVGKSVAGALIGGAVAGGVGTVAGAVIGANGKRKPETETEEHYHAIGGEVFIINKNDEEICIYSRQGLDCYTTAKHISKAVRSVINGEPSQVTPPMSRKEKANLGCWVIAGITIVVLYAFAKLITNILVGIGIW